MAQSSGGFFPALFWSAFGQQSSAGEDPPGEARVTGGPFPMLFWSAFGQQPMDGSGPPGPGAFEPGKLWFFRNRRRFR